ncbi:MAG: MG2 domain-containing protein [Candidatus Aminicenantes bacterium]|nr:MG2 domain-containing protein [Candidatus Aminicenantes bacterium]
MKEKSIICLIVMMTLPLILPSGCKSKKENGSPPGMEAQTGDLSVTYASPKGSTEDPHEADTLVIIFDHSMAPLEALPQGRGSRLMQLDPSFAGKHRWLNPKTLTFTPDKPFPSSTEIKVTIPAGTKSYEGFTLKEDFSWTFQTIRPRLIRHFPRHEQKWVRPDTEVLLIFNQPIQKAKNFFSLMRVGQDNIKIPINFSLKTPSEESLKEDGIEASIENTLLLQPKEKLELDSKYVMEIEEGLPGKQGSLGMEKPFSFFFETYTTFQFVSFGADENHNPYDSLQFTFSNPVPYKEFVQKIRFEPEITIPDYYLEWDHGDSTLWISLSLQPEIHYKLWIGSELEDIFGNKLAKEIPLEFATASYPASLSMNSGHKILEAYSDLNYPLYVLNTPEILFEATRLGKEDILPLLANKKIFWSSEKLVKKDFFSVQKKLELNIPRNKKDVLPLNLAEFFPAKYGTIFLQLDTFLEDKWTRYPKAMLQVTELGLSAKFSPENNLIWITELQSGNPLAEVAIEIRDDSNKIFWRGKTDERGTVQTPGWKILGIKSKSRWSQPQQWIFATKGKDFAFLSSEWDTGFSPYRFNIPFDWNPQPVEIEGYTFTDRGLYRAGETVHIKSIIRKREKGEWKMPSIEQVECEVLDPFNKSLLKRKVTLDAFGSFDLDIETTPEASLGSYEIKVTISPLTKDGKESTLFSSFRVEAFKPAEFEVHLRSAQEEYIFGNTYDAEVRASYLYGGAMASQKVSWHLRLNPAFFNPPGHEDFIFGNQIDRWERYGQEDSRLLSSGESILDEDGKLKISAKLLPEGEKNSVFASLEATVQGPSRRSISNRIQTLVHQGEYYIGLQPSTTFLPKGEGMAVRVITVKSDGQIEPKQKIRLKLLQREWHSVRKSGIGGIFHWVSEKVDTEIEARTIESKKEPQQLDFIPKKAGFYLLEAEGKDSRGNTITTKTYFYVTGEDYIPWERQDEDFVELIVDSSNYRPGDVAKILVKSPYERANALITVEREFVLHSEIREIIGSSSQIAIPIRSDYLPNVYVSVLLVQGRTAPKVEDNTQDLGKPSFKIGYAKLNVDPSEKRLEIDILKTKNAYKPGEEVSLDLKVKDWKRNSTKASLALAVVDVGVLNLIGYQTPDPFSHFYSQKFLAVHTSDSRPFVLEQLAFGEKGEEAGGGLGETMKTAFAQSLSEIELRGDFRFTAHWDPSLLTDDEGNARVSFTLPDNLTTFRVMAVAQTQDSRFGRSETTFKVTKPLLLQSALPRFARVGDEFSGGVVIHNQTSKKAVVVLECLAKGILLKEEINAREISLSPGESQEVLFPFKVEKPGRAEFEFRAQMGEETDGLQIFLPLKLPRPRETVALFGETTESTEEKIRTPEDVYPEESRIEFFASASALSELRESVDFLTDYPFLCLEQRLSSILPYIVAKEVLSDFSLSHLSPGEMHDHVQQNLKEIYDYQRENGGFGLWPDSPYDSPFNSCYAAFALVMAKSANFAVDEGCLDRLTQYLKNLMHGRVERQDYPYGQRAWKTIQAFALYSLALLSQPEPSYAEKLFVERELLSLSGKIFLLKALNKGKGSTNAQNTLIQELMNKVKVSPTSAHFEDDEGREGRWIYSSNNRTTALILQGLIEVEEDNPLLSSVARWLVERRKAGTWATTQENFYVFYALSEFYKKYEKIDPDFKIEVSLEGKRLLEESIKLRNQVEKTERFLGELEPGIPVPLKIKKTGKGRLYYQARMTYAPKRELLPRDEGFSIMKEISTLDGKALDSIQAGTLAVVTLQVILPQESLFVVLEDPLPAGFEAVNPTFLTESEERQRQMEESAERGQRKWWRGFNHIEMRDDRVLLFADSLAPGIHTHRYLVRALTYGTFHAPGTKIEEMYAPEVFGRSGELTIKILK